MFIYFCDICNKEFDRFSNYDRHLKSNLHHKKCIKIEESKEKSECKGCGCEFLKNSENYYNHLKRNAFLDNKEYEFFFENKNYDFSCNKYIEECGAKFKHLNAEQAEKVLMRYRMFKELEGEKKIHKQKWAERVVIKEEDFKEEVNVELNQDDLKKLEAIEDDLNSKGIINSYLQTRVNGYEVLGSEYKHWYNNEPYYLYYCPYTEEPIAYEWLDTFNHKHFYLAC